MNVEQMPNIVPEDEREWFVLFAICVAGKSAKQTQEKLEYQYLWQDQEYVNNACSPFEVIKKQIKNGDLTYYLKLCKFGQYKRIEKAFREIVKLDVTKDLTIEKLEAIPGIGPKTARFIVLYTHPKANCVPLDTHILKFLAKEFPWLKIPKSTPAKGKRYNELETLFQALAAAEGKTVRQLDTEVWQSYAKKD